MKKIKFYTLGCKVNQYDTQRIRNNFLAAGFVEACQDEEADYCLINTCTVTHRADADSLNIIRKAIRQNRRAEIIVTGCLAELDKNKIKQIKGVGFIVPNKEKDSLLRHISLADDKNIINLDGVKVISDFSGRTRAFLKIQDGCNNFCSYCKVPLVRGLSRSRALDEIVKEARGLVNSGFKEIVLTGICLGSYGEDLDKKTNLVNLIQALEVIPNLIRIRLSSIEAGDISKALVSKLASSIKLCKHLHIPIQSGDDSILKRMNRRYNRRFYLQLIKNLRRKVSNVSITTDVLVGFPSENWGNFNNTIKLIKSILPLKVHIFPYSRRDGTLAADKFKEEELDSKIIRDRIAQLKEVSDSCSFKCISKFIGEEKPVLFEGNLNNDPSFWEGLTDNYLRVVVRSKIDLKNKIRTVLLKEARKDHILGDILP